MARIGHGFDVHRLTEGRALVLGGATLKFDKGLMGHSDADVLTHAVCDALLGAAALGDIGKYFPDSDDKYKGISSIDLLGRVWVKIDEAGYCVGNIDVTVAAQAPKLAPYIEEMRKNLADILQTDIGAISIKATTTDGIGFIGRQEGIAAWAVAALNEK